MNGHLQAGGGVKKNFARRVVHHFRVAAGASFTSAAFCPVCFQKPGSSVAMALRAFESSIELNQGIDRNFSVETLDLQPVFASHDGRSQAHFRNRLPVAFPIEITSPHLDRFSMAMMIPETRLLTSTYKPNPIPTDKGAKDYGEVAVQVYLMPMKAMTMPANRIKSRRNRCRS